MAQAQRSSSSSATAAATMLTDKVRQRMLLPTNNNKPLLMGCVCYDPAVGDIWGGIRQYLNEEAKVPFDFVLFTNYEQQVASLLQRHIDVAWNGPLAHVLLEEHADASAAVVISLGMRDVDRDFESIVIVSKAANISQLQDLNGRTVLTGASDSPQAHVVPLHYLESVQKIQFGKVMPQDLDLGKHGDTAAGEVRAMEILIGTKEEEEEEKAQVAIVSKMMWDRACQGMLPTVDAQRLKDTCEVSDAVELPVFDHCQFDAILQPNTDPPGYDQNLDRFAQALLDMDMANPKHEPLMKLEGIQKRWEGPRQNGYDIVRSAMGRPSILQQRTVAVNGIQQIQKRSYSTTGSAVLKEGGSTKIKVTVVGAGVAGLQTVRALQARSENFEVTAFEGASTVGGLWKQNYSNFGVQVPKQLYEFQDYPMSDLKWGEYASGPQVQSYIERYTDSLGLRPLIQFNTKVTSVAQQNGSSGSNWKIHTESTVDGSASEHDFDYVVFSTGLYSSVKKNLPAIPGSSKGTFVHSSDFSDASVAKGQNVVVVGSGKSATDCAVEAQRAGASSVTLLQRTPHWLTPRMIAGVIPFQYTFLSRFGQALVSTHSQPIPGSGTAINAFYNSGIGPLLMKPVFRVVEELFAFQFGLRGDLRPKNDVVKDFYDVAQVLNSESKKLRQSGKIDVKVGEMESYDHTDKRLTLKGGSKVNADIVICATGFQQDYSMLDSTTQSGLDLQDDGLYLYRCVLPEKVPNMAFVGHTAAISNISSYGLQAEWLARYLSNELETKPDDHIVVNDVQARRNWARSWMPPCANRGMNVLLHQTHYHDQLLRDMGENPSRKSNPLSEYLMPYEPADYNGIMGGNPKPISNAALE